MRAIQILEEGFYATLFAAAAIIVIGGLAESVDQIVVHTHTLMASL